MKRFKTIPRLTLGEGKIDSHVNKRVRMHEFVYKICKSRGKYFLYFQQKVGFSLLPC